MLIPGYVADRFDTACTVEVEHTAEFLHAHVALEGDIEVGPGDRVRVHGAPIQVQFGEKLVEHRSATVERAGWVRRETTKLLARLEFMELFEISFTDEKYL